MSADKYCAIHGVYAAEYDACPYCAAQATLPPAPRPLGSEPQHPERILDGGAPTLLSGGGGRKERLLDGDDETELGPYAEQERTVLALGDPNTLGILWLRNGARRGKIYPLKDGVVIGGAQAEINLEDPKAGNPHARITFEDGAFIIWPFGTKAGTFVNGERIRGATTLQENDTLKIGDTELVLKTLAP